MSRDNENIPSSFPCVGVPAETDIHLRARKRINGDQWEVICVVLTADVMHREGRFFTHTGLPVAPVASLTIM
jgi:hypothetical protein